MLFSGYWKRKGQLVKPGNDEWLKARRESEKRIVHEMIGMYCRHHHRSEAGELCPDCSGLYEYVSARTDHCPFMKTKTFCSACKVHCYSPEMRQKIKQVMAWAGPRIFFRHPLLALRHALLARTKNCMPKSADPI